MQKHCLIQPERSRLQSVAHYAGAVVALCVCVLAAISSGSAGASRLLSEYGSAADSLAATKRALDFNPNDPDAHYHYAVRLADTGNAEAALAEFEQAAKLRPSDYFLWQELGRARDDNEDARGAISALQKAIELAPQYAQAHWLVGNILLRNNDPEAAFSEMRLAVKSDPTLLPLLLDLAWGFSEGNSQFVVNALAPASDRERVNLARFLIGHGQIKDSVDLVQRAQQISTDDSRVLVADLLAKQEFTAAHNVWLKGRGDDAQTELVDGDFELPVTAGNQGFGWRPTQLTQTVHILVDPNDPQSGKRSLRVEYAGNFETGQPVISQLVVLPPHTRYRLTFSARTENLVSGALPLIAVSDAKSNQIICQTEPLAAGTNAWREFSLDFETASGDAVLIRIQRQSCAVQPCPIFGRAWYDNFSIISGLPS